MVELPRGRTQADRQPGADGLFRAGHLCGRERPCGKRRSELLVQVLRLRRDDEPLGDLVHQRLHVFEDAVGRAEAGLDRPHAEQPIREAVDGAEERAVQLADGRLESFVLLRGGLGRCERLQQRLAHTEPQLAGRLAGKRDGGQLGQLWWRAAGALGRHQIHHAVHQRLGLPGAGARIDHDVARALAHDRVALFLIGRPVGLGRPSRHVP